MLLSKTLKKVAAGLATLSLAGAAVPAAAVAQTSGPVNPQAPVAARVIKHREKNFLTAYNSLTREAEQILKSPFSAGASLPNIWVIGMPGIPASLDAGTAYAKSADSSYLYFGGASYYGSTSAFEAVAKGTIVCNSTSATPGPANTQCHLTNLYVGVPPDTQNGAVVNPAGKTTIAGSLRAYTQMNRLEQKIVKKPDSLGTYFAGRSGKPKAGAININSAVAGTDYSLNAAVTCKNVSSTKNVQCYLSGMSLNS